MKNKVVLITGANGGLGTSITRSFLVTGASVTGVSNKISAEEFPQPNFTPVSADLTKASTVNDVVLAAATSEPDLPHRLERAYFGHDVPSALHR